ncbi:MAG: methyltransferase domain-containing protein [Acidobacteria bacterium]|nr:methyltransferase domain-containing protein [Acidobacteriota bacterium]
MTHRLQAILRDAVVMHCGQIADAEERRTQALAILGFLANSAPSEAYRNFVRSEMERLAEAGADAVDALFDASPGEESGSVSWSSNALYHEVAYPSYVHSQTHPDHLAMMSRVFGLKPAAINKCRVLELGCGTGYGLIAAAVDLPESQFVGVDFSARMIEEAKQAALAAVASNVTFAAADILSFEPEGEFDFIVAHGVYSWTPLAVRERILQICGRKLAPNGVAYVSFNARPGYHLPAILRDFALSAKPATLDEAYAALERLDLSTMPETWAQLLAPCADHFWSKQSRVQVMYDEFAEINEPFLFREFADALSRHGLRYAAEARIEDWTANTIEPRARQMLNDLAGDPVRRMQYRDCLRLTRFHASLVCRDTVQPTIVPIPDIACTMRVSTRAVPLSPDPDIKGPAKELFESPDGVQVAIAEPLLKAALVVLSQQRPRRLLLGKLAIEACKLLGVEDRAAEQKLRAWLMPFWEGGFFELHSHMPNCATELNRKPVASQFARYAAERGEALVPSLLGCVAALGDDTDRQLLLALDGTRSQTKLAEELGLAPEDVTRRLGQFLRMGLLEQVI